MLSYEQKSLEKLRRNTLKSLEKLRRKVKKSLEKLRQMYGKSLQMTIFASKQVKRC